MKKLLIFFLFSFISISSNAQYGDKEQEVDNLAHLAKVWGFLKYHHPAIKECTIDWDGALLHSLSKLYGAPQSDYPAIVEQLIDTAGVFVGQTGDKPILIDDEELNNLDVTWFQSSHLTPAIQAKLEQIYEESRESEHCLLASVMYELRIEAEKSYDELGQYPSRDHRVLAVFTYWNIIEYFFPYKHIMDQDWDTTLEQFATSIAYAEDALDYHLRFGEFTSYINDTHGFFTSTTFSEEWLGSERAPFRARYIEGKTVITRVHESVTRLEVGDIILGIDGQPIEERLDTLKKYLFGSNEAALLRVAHFFLPNGQAGNFDITVQIPNGTIFTATDLYRSSEEFQFQDEEDPAWKKIVSSECGEVGYIDMGTFKGIDMPTVVSDLWEKKGLIIDLRLLPNTQS